MNNEHGGDLTGYQMQYGKLPLDFSASLNPRGMPPVVKQAAILAVDSAYAYPDPYARQLTSALAKKLDVAPNCLLLGNGSADLIYRYVQAVQPHRALLPVPSFSEYERALQSVGCDIQYHGLRPENDFELAYDILPQITPEVDVLFLCQPGNPTGRLLPSELLGKVLNRCRETGTSLFLDECFVPFVEDPGAVSLVNRIGKNPCLFILGSFTKLYGMAGIRLGYGLCGDADLLDKMTLNSQSWAVSTVAQAAGLAALDQDAWVRESLDLIAAEKEWLVSALQKLGIHVIGAAANYLFFAARDATLKDKLAAMGILIRDCSNFHGLGPGYYRVAVRTRHENERLIESLESVMEKQEVNHA